MDIIEKLESRVDDLERRISYLEGPAVRKVEYDGQSNECASAVEDRAREVLDSQLRQFTCNGGHDDAYRLGADRVITALRAAGCLRDGHECDCTAAYMVGLEKGKEIGVDAGKVLGKKAGRPNERDVESFADDMYRRGFEGGYLSGLETGRAECGNLPEFPVDEEALMDEFDESDLYNDTTPVSEAVLWTYHYIRDAYEAKRKGE